jgi:hypothetical protein
VRPDIAEQLSLHAQLPLDLNATSPLQRTFDMVPNCPLIRARLNLLSQRPLGIAMPLATNWQASEKAVYYQRFLFSLDPRFHDESAQCSACTASAQAIGSHSERLA